MAASSRATFMVESFFTMLSHVQGCLSAWDATIGAELECARESDNPTHCYAVAMKKGNETVGHIPWAMSKMVHAQCVCIWEHVHMWQLEVALMCCSLLV